MSTALRIIARYLAKTEEKFSPLVDAQLEVPTKLAVESTLDEHPASSGFHEGFSQDKNGLDPCWAIIYDGQVSETLVHAAKEAGLRVTLRYMENEKGVITDVTLDDIKQSETDKARAIFDKFADIYQNLASKVRRVMAVSGYDRDLIKPGYKGTFVIHNHRAERAGHHFDLRISMPVKSLAKALGHYGTKRGPSTTEPRKEEYPDKPGEVLRSFADRKCIIPTKSKKVFIVETEDHPIQYGSFRGTIPEGEYGAGKVDIWDKGSYELLDVEGDKKYIIDFHGKKLNGKFALVKYQTGYLWIKMSSEKTASIIDYTRPTLPPQIWDIDKGDAPSIRDSVREFILGTLIGSLEQAGLSRPYAWLDNIWLTGSIASYNYLESSDVDVNIRFKGDVMRSIYPDLKDMPDTDIREYLKKIIYVHNKKPVAGTSHTMGYVILTESDLDSDAIFDLIKNEWIKPSQKVSIDFDPDKAFIKERRQAEIMASQIDLVIGNIIRNINDLRRVDEYLKFHVNDDMIDKRVLYLKHLQIWCECLDKMHAKIRKIWHYRFNNPQNQLDFPAYNYSTNWESNNIVFKFLQKWQYHRPVGLLYGRLENDPYLKIIDQFIPD